MVKAIAAFVQGVRRGIRQATAEAREIEELAVRPMGDEVWAEIEQGMRELGRVYEAGENIVELELELEGATMTDVQQLEHDKAEIQAQALEDLARWHNEQRARAEHPDTIMRHWHSARDAEMRAGEIRSKVATRNPSPRYSLAIDQGVLDHIGLGEFVDFVQSHGCRVVHTPGGFVVRVNGGES